MIQKVEAKTIDRDLVRVVPMDKPTGGIFYMDLGVKITKENIPTISGRIKAITVSLYKKK
jgi:hypothetical protein